MRIDPSSFQAALALERGRVILIPSGDFAIPLTVKRPGGRHGRWDGTCTVVSPRDSEGLAKWSWCMDNHGYVRRRGKNGSSVRMHRQIMGIGPGVRRDSAATPVVDHMNHDPLDNRRENLRVCTQSENAQNKRSQPGSSSTYRGVSLKKGRGGYKGKPWEAYGMTSRAGGATRKKIHLGQFATEQEAADAAAAWRRENLPFSIEQEIAA